jgi:hypothetical protein
MGVNDVSRYVNLSPAKHEELSEAIYDFIEKNSGVELNDEDLSLIEESVSALLQEMRDE